MVRRFPRTTIAAAIHTGRNRSRVESFLTTPAGAAGLSVTLMPHRRGVGGHQDRGQSGEDLGMDPVIHPGPAPLAGDQAGFPQHLEVVRDRRTGHAERVG
jgi:hypothetical protein